MAVTGVFKGSLIGVHIDGLKVACETNSDFNYNIEMIPASSQMSGKFKEYVPGQIDWSLTVDANMLLTTAGAGVKTVLDAVISGSEVGLEFKTNDDITPYFRITGNGFPQTGGIVAPSDDLATWNVTFLGNGPFTVDNEEFWLIINAMPPASDKPTIVDQNIW